MADVLRSELQRLLRLLANGDLTTLGVIPWASPVLAFGRLSKSNIASLGLNPSNLEFVGDDGKELLAPYNRFETLGSLRLKSWSRVPASSIDRIVSTCERYFGQEGRPYHGWFRPLDKLIGPLGASYYDSFFPACHLDLVPFATTQKWSALAAHQRTALIELGVPSLLEVLSSSDIRVLVLNGATVVRSFEALIDQKLDQLEMSSWSLERGKGPRVKGYAFKGLVDSIRGKPLGRRLLVLGYNHNIQSSFGVRSAVATSIGGWIRATTEEERVFQ